MHIVFFETMSETIKHDGVVESVKGKIARVKILQVSACSTCNAKSVCNASDQQEKVVDALLGDTKVYVGEHVNVVGEKSIAVKAVLIAFVVPFVLMLVVLFAVDNFTNNELKSGLAALGVLIPYFFVVYLFRNALQKQMQFHIEKM